MELPFGSPANLIFVPFRGICPYNRAPHRGPGIPSATHENGGRHRIELDLEPVGVDPNRIDLEAMGSIDEGDGSLLILVDIYRDPYRTGPSEDELFPRGRLVLDGVPELGKPRQLGMCVVNVQEIDRRIDDPVVRAFVGGT
jgi:hypothetical protein